MQVRSKTQAMLDFDADPERPGRPLMVLLGGAALALLALAFIVMIAYRTWVLEENTPERAYSAIGLLFGMHTAGVFLFAYAYESYDMGKALRLTIVFTLFSVILIAAVIGTMALLTRPKEILGAAGSFVDGSETGAASRASASFFPLGAGATTMGRFDRPAGDVPFVVTCIGCGREFTPAPPRAACPFCGRENVKAG